MLAIDPIDVLILAGGLGTRLAPITDALPKALVPVLGRPFVEYVIEDLSRGGLSRFVLSVNYRKEQVIACLGDGARLGVSIRYAPEEALLGTGGAVKHALPLLSVPFFVVNGDTLLELDPQAMLALHVQQGQAVTMATAFVENRDRYGALHLSDQRVVRFEEKRAGLGAGPVNGGVYVMEPRALAHVAATKECFSLERDVLAPLAGKLACFETRGFFVDMGTHEVLATLDSSLSAYLEARPKTRWAFRR